MSNHFKQTYSYQQPTILQPKFRTGITSTSERPSCSLIKTICWTTAFWLLGLNYLSMNMVDAVNEKNDGSAISAEQILRDHAASAFIPAYAPGHDSMHEHNGNVSVRAVGARQLRQSSMDASHPDNQHQSTQHGHHHRPFEDLKRFPGQCGKIVVRDLHILKQELPGSLFIQMPDSKPPSLDKR
ncbi:hypothetical protein CYMTET_41683 [Cymbomonas tetramitiformis]|uniref:Uncharacterized protein n=1 Tax=Cymbomonas tetramitiformis TaxID=36881 RepID=A0AAE0C6N0_9CHLO|nr:hypothetical protein CYMTET_41683 [Cymbomonas tetramitiformis]